VFAHLGFGKQLADLGTDEFGAGGLMRLAMRVSSSRVRWIKASRVAVSRAALWGLRQRQ